MLGSTAWHIAKTTLATENKTQQIGYFFKKVLVELDFTYLQQWGNILEISQELAQAFRESDF
jgi:hypothetical protein